MRSTFALIIAAAYFLGLALLLMAACWVLLAARYILEGCP